MATPAQIDITANTSDAVQEFNNFGEVLRKSNLAVKEFTVETQVFNREGKRLSGTLKGITQEGQEFVASFGRVAKTVEVAGVKVKTFDEVLKKVSFTKVREEAQLATVALHRFEDKLGDISKLQANFSQAAGTGAQFDAFGQDFAKNNAFVKQLTQQVNQFNGQGQQTGAVIRGITKDGRSFTATFEGMRDAANRLIQGANGVELGLKGINFDTKTKEAKELEDAHTANVEKANLLSSAFGRLQRAAQYFVAYKAFNFIATEISDGVAAANKLQIQLSLIRTLSQDQQTNVGTLGKQIAGVSRSSGFDINDVAQGFYDTVSNQVAKGPNVGPFVSTAAELARVTGSTLPDAVNTLTSAINSYGLSAGDAERVSAILFRTVDEGRITLAEVSNTLGRVGVIGKNLGIPMEELAATLAITTQKGFKTADAMTLLTNLMIKLEKPTDATEKLFKSLGVSTGEEAIRLFGYTGVLQKMVDLTKAGIVPVSAFFDEIRGRKQFGVFEQSIGDIDKLSNKMKDVAATAQNFDNAKGIRAESPADSLNKQANRIKVFATQEIGGDIVNRLDYLLKKANEIDDALSQTFGTNKNDAVRTLELSVYAVGAAMAATAVRALALNATMLTLTKSTALYALAFAGAAKTGQLIGNAFQKTGGRIIDPNDLESLALFSQYLKEVEASKNRIVSTPAIDLFGEAGKNALGILAQLSVKNDQVLEQAKTKAKQAADVVKTSFAAYADTIKANVSGLKKAITDANNELEQSQRRALQFNDALEAILFNTRLKYANDTFGGFDNQKIQLVGAEIDKLTTKAQKLYALNDAESVKEGDRLLLEAARLEQQRFDLEDDVDRKQVEAGVKADPQLYDPTGSGQVIREVDTTRLEQRLARIQAIKNQGQQRFEQAQTATINNSTRELEIQTKRLRLFEDTAKKLAELTPLTADGKVKPQYLDKDGKFDEKKFNAERDALTGNLIANAKTDENRGLTGPTERLKLEAALFDFQKTQIKEVAALERQTYLDTIKAKQQADLDAIEARKIGEKKARDELVDANKKQIDFFGSSLRQLQAFEDNAGQQLAPKTGFGFIDDNLNLNAGLSATERAAFERTRAARQAAQTAKAGLGEDQVLSPDGALIPSPQAIRRSEDALASYKRELLNLQQLVANKKQQSTLLVNNDPISGKALTIEGVGSAATTQLGNIERNNETLNKAGLENIDKSIADMDKQNQLLGSLKTAFPEMALEAEKAAARLPNALQPAIQSTDELIRKVKELKLELQGLPGGTNLKSDLGGGDASYAAVGGTVGRFPGSPRGTDVHPYWLTTGERIIDSVTSSLYRPQLDAIMSRRVPRYASTGGIVGGDTNVGDISVTVNGGPTNDGTGRAVVGAMQRQLRLRNVRRF